MSRDNLYQKTGLTVNNIALDLIAKKPGDRVESIRYYQELYGVSRGTVQNAFNELINSGAIEIDRRGRLGSYISSIDYDKVQSHTKYHQILGIMIIPYSVKYEGIATALYLEIKNVKFNLAYIRGAKVRLDMVRSDACQFALVSRFSAERYIEDYDDLEIVIDLGEGSSLSKHVILLKGKDSLSNGMKVAYDEDSLDQRFITDQVFNDFNVKKIPIRTQETVEALEKGIIDAGIWNYDEIEDKDLFEQFKILFINNEEYTSKFTSLVIVTSKRNKGIKEILKKYIDKNKTLDICKKVENGEIASMV